ncbi:hypothetical protein EST38_g14297 [Candolleomyces aberdarensis]|uniref:Uncharacterized protein n=1 Tax=Candolleomyces aberdarensis TaxID=2316362 RepID=A0A4V1Q1H0_9AGAR|nr:hypothetical protein EST38_g14297 [Candolleomyces aberdarensis]
MPQEQPIDVEGAERLKTQGNELYGKKDYSSAHLKYTEAIKKDPKNPILYANRAAALLALKKYSDAAWDCTKAVELDPTYVKAWGRLGTAAHALSAWEKSLWAWQKALDCLPKDNLSPEQRNMKTRFEEGLNKAKVAKNKIETNATPIYADQWLSGKMPWQRAAALKSKKMAARAPSCTFVVDYAYEDFKEGMDAIAETKVISTQPGVELLCSKPKVIQCLTNAILTDARVFHMTSPDFSDKMRRQCLFEDQYLRGWATTGGPAIVKQEAPERLRSEGWDKLRQSLSVTVRIWIFNAFFWSQMLGHHNFAREMYTNTLEVLAWGRRQWPNVRREDRGSIFDNRFIRGVKKFQLEAMHASVFRGEGIYTFQDLINFAEDIIASVNSEMPPPQDFHHGHFLAYWMYPKGTALSVIGWCHLGKAIKSSKNDAEKNLNFERAAKYYLDAAQAFPEDEEQHSRFLQKHLECLCFLKKPLRETLPLCQRIRKALDQALDIWFTPPYGDVLKVTLDQVKAFESKYNQQIADGKCTLNSIGELPEIKRPPTPPSVDIEFRDA